MLLDKYEELLATYIFKSIIVEGFKQIRILFRLYDLKIFNYYILELLLNT